MGGTPFGALVGGVLADAFDVLVAFAVAAVGVGTSAVATSDGARLVAIVGRIFVAISTCFVAAATTFVAPGGSRLGGKIRLISQGHSSKRANEMTRTMMDLRSMNKF